MKREREEEMKREREEERKRGRKKEEMQKIEVTEAKKTARCYYFTQRKRHKLLGHRRMMSSNTWNRLGYHYKELAWTQFVKMKYTCTCQKRMSR